MPSPEAWRGGQTARRRPGMVHSLIRLLIWTQSCESERRKPSPRTSPIRWERGNGLTRWLQTMALFNPNSAPLFPLPSDGSGNSGALLGLNNAMVCNQRVNPFPLSHRMGEVRGEGFLRSLSHD